MDQSQSTNPAQLNTPVALLIFNRPNTTDRVFEAVRQVAPKKLFVVADGPRPDRPDDAEKCKAARAIVERVDWPCELFTNFSDENLGCGLRPATGISWVFENVEQAIILEDDCLPDPAFFRFCEELLEKYRDDQRVMHVGGSNFLFGRAQIEDSYYFSRYPLCWGWATWRRAWRHFDFELRDWPSLRQNKWLDQFLGDKRASWHWSRLFDYVRERGQSHIWDYQWILSCWRRDGLCITPSVNLVSNVGYGKEATHTRRRSRFAEVPREAMSFPLRHPKTVARNVAADEIRQNDLCPSLVLAYAKEIARKSFGKLLRK